MPVPFISIGREGDFQKAVTLTGNWTRYAVSGTVNHTNSAHIIYNESGKDCDAYVRLPMVEKGTIAHDWQPAPEDTQSQIDANKTSAANAHTSADNLCFIKYEIVGTSLGILRKSQALCYL